MDCGSYAFRKSTFSIWLWHYSCSFRRVQTRHSRPDHAAIFTQENIQRFLQREEDAAQQLFNVEPLLDRLDYDQLFQGLVDAIAESSFGSMLAMVGGVAALDPLKEPVCKKIRLTLAQMTQSPAFIDAIHEGINAQQISGDLIDDIEAIVEKRLDELTPDMVKTIIQQMIKEHLGWLVVWGGVFGAMIGFVFSLL